MSRQPWVFLGCYTCGAGAGEGIYTCKLDPKTGVLTPVAVFKEIENPSFVNLSHNGQYLYAVIEIGDFAGKKSGGVAAFKIDQQSGKLTLLNQRATDGVDPCHVNIDQTDKVVVITNYTSGSVAVFPVNADGSLGEQKQFIQYQTASHVNPIRQEGPHAHSAFISANNRYMFIQDLGGDYIHQYKIDLTQQKIIENNPTVLQAKPGAGPRHLAFHPNQRYAYIVTELSNTVIVCDYAAQTGLLTEKQIVTTLPADFRGESISADIHVTADGRFLYTSNRGHDSLAIFAINKDTGELTAIGHQATLGKAPRNFFITPDDKLLLCANQDTNNIVSFWRDKQTGLLTATGQQLAIGKPVCIQMMTY
jgi:6-phosphogluconolactonase